MHPGMRPNRDIGHDVSGRNERIEGGTKGINAPQYKSNDGTLDESQNAQRQTNGEKVGGFHGEFDHDIAAPGGEFGRLLL